MRSSEFSWYLWLWGSALVVAGAYAIIRVILVLRTIALLQQILDAMRRD